ncbi:MULTISPECIES: UrcA family protein [Sphingomonas]|uniref:UrcA family protein n=1 Tax=Sphingomonas leidyi TaxID=68569 RepID=A0A7X5V026_9SPHN|nr:MULTISPECIES: UrcA family protein [Sphingomonas]MBN8812899.1 UrcA family protein [Sphingomonas sp.]NIJ65095.1 UrcA family protein [Sphingomonas leidyi]
MRSILFLSVALVGACASHPPMPVGEPALRVAYGDLQLDTRAGRAALRERLDGAARTYCRTNDRDAAPQLIRNKAGYCFDMVRLSLVAEMPDRVRRGYYRR